MPTSGHSRGELLITQANLIRCAQASEETDKLVTSLLNQTPPNRQGALVLQAKVLAAGYGNPLTDQAVPETRGALNHLAKNIRSQIK